MSASTTDRAFSEAPGADGTLFVINLCASTSPLALVHPSNPELKRYTFFVTRQREDGRERFRLHMGYFQSQADAESLLAAVRDVYPAAWAGPAPTSGGAPRRPRAVARSAAPASPAAPAAQKAAPPAQKAAPPVQKAAPVVETPAPARESAAAAPTPAAAAPRTRSAPPAPPLDAMSNVRDVLAQLSDETPNAAPLLQPPGVQPPVLRPVAPAPKPAAPAAGQLSATQTLRLLEETKTPARDAAAPARVAPAPAAPAPPAPAPAPAAPPLARSPVPEEPEDENVRVVTPEDTQTLRDIHIDRQNNAPPCFAVQLLWSVAPINAADHPHLAIFEAYTLYAAEGSRQGRRWYGLRLGFFKDPNAATQVAYYVRSDYPTVAVVPVAQKERDHALGRTDEFGKPVTAPPPAAASAPRPYPHAGLAPRPYPPAAGAAPPAAARAAPPAQPAQQTQPQPALKVPPPVSPSKPVPPKATPLSKAPLGKAVAAKPAPGAAASKAGVEGFELLEDDRPPPIKRDVGDSDPDAALPERTEKPTKVRPKGPEGKPMPPKASGKPSGKRVVVRKTGDVGRVTPGASTPLDETFEILGASTLTLDESHEVINDDKVRRKEDKKKKPEGSGGRLSRLLNRLGG